MELRGMNYFVKAFGTEKLQLRSPLSEQELEAKMQDVNNRVFLDRSETLQGERGSHKSFTFWRNYHIDSVKSKRAAAIITATVSSEGAGCVVYIKLIPNNIGYLISTLLILLAIIIPVSVAGNNLRFLQSTFSSYWCVLYLGYPVMIWFLSYRAKMSLLRIFKATFDF